MPLQDKVAIVTGVSNEGQVGQAVAQRLAGEGVKLVLVARNAEHVQARAAEITAQGGEALAVAADLTREDEACRAVQQALDRFGRVDILVNLAGGLTRYKGIEDYTLEDWEAEVGNNLLSAWLCSRAVFGVMKQQGGGRIVNFARAGEPQAKMVGYSVAKAGIVALTRTLALEGRKHNIAANAVAPGLVDTKSNTESMKPKPEEQARWPTRQEIAEVVAFLASDGASGISGQVVPVQGRLL